MSSNFLAEQSVIGGILRNDSKLSDVQILINHNDFEDDRNARYFLAIESLSAKCEPIDVITICDWLQDMGYAPDLAYLMEISKATPSAANVDAYARAVKDVSTERNILGISSQMALIIHGEGRTDEKLEEIHKLISTVGNENYVDIRDAGTVMRNLVNQWDERAARGDGLLGYSTGIESFDRRTTGLQAPQLWTIAASSGRGKTTLAMNMAEHVAINQGKPVLIFSLEMMAEQLLDRMTASIGKIPLSLVKSGKHLGHPVHDSAIMPTAKKIIDSNLHIVDRGGLSIGQIQAIARQFFRKHGEGLMVVDYLGLVSGRGNNKQEQTAYVSGSLKATAKELSIPVLALAQTNRNGIQRAEKRPVASDLRDSAAIEHDSDVLIMLFEDEAENPGVMEAHFVKVRDGEKGTEYLTKNLSMNRFEHQERAFAPRAESQDKEYGGFNK